MNCLTLAQIATASNGTLIGEDRQVLGYSTDTRTVTSNDVYFCLGGDNFDGHDFAHDAVSKGAVAIVCQRQLDVAVPQVLVADTRQAFGRFAMLWRQQFRKPVVGVTGSNGKTTVKQLLASIFNQAGSAHFTNANDNNEIGVPQTLLGLEAGHDFAVVEMGASGIGEIKWLGELVQPTISVITNAGAAHLEGFGDAESVAKEKGWIYRSLREGGIAVINADDKYSEYWAGLCGDKKTITFGAAGDVLARRNADGSLSISYEGETIDCNYHLAGAHNVQNAAAASACALAAGVSLSVAGKGLSLAEPVAGRLNFIQLAGGITVIDDTYNANPASTRAAIDVLSEFNGDRYVVLGDLLELGVDEVEQHMSIGAYAKANNIDRLLAVGDLSKHAVSEFGAGADWFANKELLVESLNRELTVDATVLVKGSRSMRMEQVVAAVSDRLQQPEAGVCCQ